MILFYKKKNDGLKIRKLKVSLVGRTKSQKDIKINIEASHGIESDNVPERYMIIKLSDGEQIRIDYTNNKLNASKEIKEIIFLPKFKKSYIDVGISNSQLIWPDKLELEHIDAFENSFNYENATKDQYHLKKLDGILSNLSI